MIAAPAICLAVFVGQAAVADVMEFEQDAMGWMMATPGWEAYAFDEFLPGVDGGGGDLCLVDPPNGTGTLALAGGSMTVWATDWQGTPSCPIADMQNCCFRSDGRIEGLIDKKTASDGKLVLEFEPPIDAFYAYYGSLQTGQVVYVRLFAGGVPVCKPFSGPVSTDGAVGHGFVLIEPIDRIEFTTTEYGFGEIPGIVTLGAFSGLASGEPSLGTVAIPEYGGAAVQLDFGVRFIPPCLDADLNDDGVVDISDLVQVIVTWGACPDPPALCFGDVTGDGVVDVADLIRVIVEWGPCE